MLGRGLKVLELLSEKGALTDVQIAQRLDYPLLIVQQLLVVYKDSGYVFDNRHGQYDLSLKVLDIGQKFSSRINARQVAFPFLKRLFKKYNETTTLAKIDMTDIVYIDKIESKELLRYVPPQNQPQAAHHTALGKAILAHLPQKELDQYCQKVSWHASTLNSIASEKELRIRLDKIRRQGFAVCDQENCIGARSIACAILDGNKYPRNAIGMWGPVERMTPSVLRQMQVDLAIFSQEIAKYYISNPKLASHRSRQSMPADYLPKAPAESEKKKTSFLNRAASWLF